MMPNDCAGDRRQWTPLRMPLAAKRSILSTSTTVARIESAQGSKALSRKGDVVAGHERRPCRLASALQKSDDVLTCLRKDVVCQCVERHSTDERARLIVQGLREMQQPVRVGQAIVVCESQKTTSGLCGASVSRCGGASVGLAQQASISGKINTWRSAAAVVYQKDFVIACIERLRSERLNAASERIRPLVRGDDDGNEEIGTHRLASA